MLPEHLAAVADRVHADLLAHPSAPGDRIRLAEVVRAGHPLLPTADVDAVVAAVAARAGGLGPLEPLLADPAVTEVMVNGGGSVWVERGGRLERTPLSVSEREVQLLVERIVAPLGLAALSFARTAARMARCSSSERPMPPRRSSDGIE